MAMHLNIYLFMILMNFSLAFATRNLTNLSNEACVGDVSIGLSFGGYQEICPEAEAIVYSWVDKAVADDPRMAASLLRLHFHDCIVNASQSLNLMFLVLSRCFDYICSMTSWT